MNIQKKVFERLSKRVKTNLAAVQEAKASFEALKESVINKSMIEGELSEQVKNFEDNLFNLQTNIEDIKILNQGLEEELESSQSIADELMFSLQNLITGSEELGLRPEDVFPEFSEAELLSQGDHSVANVRSLPWALNWIESNNI